MSVNDGYRCHLPNGDDYDYIFFQGKSLRLNVSNFRGVRCNLCQEMIPPGEGVEHKVRRKSNFICMDCVKNLVCEYELGFMVTPQKKLQACIMHHGRYTGQQLFDGLRRISESRIVKFEVTFSGERKAKSHKGVDNGPQPE